MDSFIRNNANKLITLYGWLWISLALWCLPGITFAQTPKLVLPIGHTGNITTAQFSPDGKRVITAADQVVKLWDVATGRLLADLKGHTTDILSARFSADGRKIITTDNRHVKLWDAEKAILVTDLGRSSDFTSFAALSPDGKTIVRIDSETKMYNALTSKLLVHLGKREDFFTSAAFSADGKLIATVARQSVSIWDAATGTLLKRLAGKQLFDLISARFAPDNNRLIIAFRNTASIWDIQKGALLRELKGHTDQVKLAQFLPDGKRIITTGACTTKLWDAATGTLLTDLKGTTVAENAKLFINGTTAVTLDGQLAKVWNVKTGKLRLQLKVQGGELLGALLSPNGKQVVTYAGNQARIWDASTGTLLTDLKGHTPAMRLGRFSPDGLKIATVSTNKAALWDANKGVIVANLKGHTGAIQSSCFSPDGKRLVTTGADNSARIWDASNGNILFLLKGHTGKVNYADYAADGKKIITSSDDRTAKIWDAATGALLATLGGHSSTVQLAQFSPDSRKIITVAAGSVKIWDAATGKALSELYRESFPVKLAQFSPDGQKILVVYSNSAIIWHLVLKKQIQLADLNQDSFNYFISEVQFSPGSDKILLASRYNLKVWNTETGALQTDLTGHDEVITKVAFSPDGQKIISTSVDNTAKVWHATTGALLAHLKGHQGIISSGQFSPDGNRIVTDSEDNTAKIWDAGTGKLIYTFFTVDSLDYFMQIPSGYYMSSPHAAKLLHYVTPALKVITFEQLDVRYNRPDKVLQAIGCPDTALIRSYRKAYEKRIRKLGIDTSAFKSSYQVPEADFKNREQVIPDQQTPKLKLRITGQDQTVTLDRFNVWINEVPLFGLRGISLRNRNSQQLDTTITLTLSQGKNRIETSVTNINGIESYRLPLYVNYKPAKPTPEKLYFVGIGINAFAQSQYNLRWSVKDIRDQARALKKKYGSRIVIDTLFDKRVTVTTINALKKRLAASSIDDKVILAYSGHGLLSREYDYYLSTYPVNFSNPPENGLAYDALEALLDKIPARRKLLLIDACHSGEVDKEELLKQKALQPQLAMAGIQATGERGVGITNTGTGKIGLQNSFELMQQLFVNVSRSTGATVISAAAGTQFALEKNQLQNGVFSYSILEYMQTHPHATVAELKWYVNKRVSELTAGLQVPTTRHETNFSDWQVW